MDFYSLHYTPSADRQETSLVLNPSLESVVHFRALRHDDEMSRKQSETVKKFVNQIVSLSAMNINICYSLFADVDQAA